MPGPPQLTPFDAEDRQLYPELPADGRALHPISKAELSHSLKEAHFRRWTSKSKASTLSSALCSAQRTGVAPC